MPEKYKEHENFHMFLRSAVKESRLGKLLPDALVSAGVVAYSHFTRRNNAFILPYLELCITPVCSLRCKHCANFMPLYDKPKHYTLDTMLPPLDALMKAVDGVIWFRILGGEPFLHPDLDAVIAHCRTMPAIQKIDIVTNGTIIPAKNILESMRKNNIGVYISNYGEHSRNRDKLAFQLKAHDIDFMLEEKYTWELMGTNARFGYAPDAVKVVYASCENICKTLVQGEFHVCPRSAHGTHLGFIEKRSDDYVDILSLDKTALRSALRKLYNVEYIEACYYCIESRNRKKIPAGEQASRSDFAWSNAAIANKDV